MFCDTVQVHMVHVAITLCCRNLVKTAHPPNEKMCIALTQITRVWHWI